MDAALSSLTLETLQARLESAQTALHDLMIGARTVSVRSASGSMAQYSEAQSAQLERYINQLQAAIRVKQGLSAPRGPIYLVG